MKFLEVRLDRQGRPSIDELRSIETGVVPPAPSSGSVVVTSYYSIIKKSEDYTAAKRTIILIDASSESITVTLPSAIASSSRFYTVKKVDLSNNKVIIKGNTPTETIDGEPEIYLDSPYQFITVICQGASLKWFIIGGEYMGLEKSFIEKMDTQNSLVEELLLEIKKSNLHLTNIDCEEVTDKDVS